MFGLSQLALRVESVVQPEEDQLTVVLLSHRLPGEVQAKEKER